MCVGVPFTSSPYQPGTSLVEYLTHTERDAPHLHPPLPAAPRFDRRLTILRHEREQDTKALLDRFWEPGHVCATPRVRDVDLVTGEIYTNPCQKPTCWSCGVQKGRNEASAILTSKPSHAVGWTFQGSEAPEAHCALKQWHRACSTSLPDFAVCWAAEINFSGDLLHGHGYVHAGRGNPPIDEDLLKYEAERLGIGRCSVSLIEPGENTGFYSYPMKLLAALDARRQTFLDLNAEQTKSGPRYRLMRSAGGFYRIGACGSPRTRTEVKRYNAQQYRSAKRRREQERLLRAV